MARSRISKVSQAKRSPNSSSMWPWARAGAHQRLPQRLHVGLQQRVVEYRGVAAHLAT
jgi:hypothetical protein